MTDNPNRLGLKRFRACIIIRKRWILISSPETYQVQQTTVTKCDMPEIMWNTQEFCSTTVPTRVQVRGTRAMLQTGSASHRYASRLRAAWCETLSEWRENVNARLWRATSFFRKTGMWRNMCICPSHCNASLPRRLYLDVHSSDNYKSRVSFIYNLCFSSLPCTDIPAYHKTHQLQSIASWSKFRLYVNLSEIKYMESCTFQCSSV